MAVISAGKGKFKVKMLKIKVYINKLAYSTGMPGLCDVYNAVKIAFIRAPY